MCHGVTFLCPGGTGTILSDKFGVLHQSIAAADADIDYSFNFQPTYLFLMVIVLGSRGIYRYIS